MYNCVGFIKEAIDSVLGQTMSDFEVVVVDNCSTDGTLDVVRAYKDPRIRIIQNESNIGMVGNFNKAALSARGKYVKILPADDLLYPQCLKLQSDVLEDDPNEKIALVCGTRQVLNDAGKVLFKRGFAGGRVQLSGTEAINRVIRSGGNIIGEGGAVMFRRTILEKTGGFDSKIFYVLDLDQWFKILLHGDLVALPQIVAGFRVSAGSASVQVANKQKEDYFNFIDLVRSRPGYGLTAYSYRLGKLKTAALTEVKKLIYRFVVK